jgi:hypothetical protein
MEGNDSTQRRRALLTELVPAPAALLWRIFEDANAAQFLRGTQSHAQVYTQPEKNGVSPSAYRFFPNS